MAGYSHITYGVDDGVATITLHRPDRLNAFTKLMQVELCSAFDAIDADPAVRAVVVTGAGKAFCAGADLGSGEVTFDTDNAPADSGIVREADGRHRDEGGLVSLRIFQLTKPIIAAINGVSVGVGATMTLPMDVRLASTSARFGFVFARRGIVPEACSSWFLPRVVGISRAMEWCATGRVFDAEEALAGGLVRSLHAPDDLLPAAYGIAREIADSSSGVSVALTRAMLWRLLGAPHPMEAHRLDSALVDALGASGEAREGVMSFLEKRPPAFPGKVPGDLPPTYPWWEEPEF
ncbi:MAG: crotonase/enoyl-CoA hydratase family protein [Acidimicrobiia bacterium]|nr:crotonase/enoyl-CoA hydratase family protein [Acidimicrobiia bacterium]